MKKSIYNTILYLNERTGFIYNAYSNRFLFANRKLCAIFNSESVEYIKDTYNIFYSNLQKAEIIVPEEINERQRVVSLLKKIDTDDAIYHLTILPTINCIFKCWYCYEDHLKGTKMSGEIIRRTDKLLNNIILNKKTKNIHVSFFGGEPFMHYDIIIHFIKHAYTQDYREDLSVSSSITTNGYLIKESMIKEIKQYCDNMSFQITLDGNRAAHNRVRYTSPQKGSYDKILSNVKMIIDNGFHVRLRLNYTNENIDSMINIVDDLANIPLKIKDKLDVSLYRVWQDVENGNIDSKVNLLLSKFRNEKINVSAIPPLNLYTSCYADKKNGAVINYDGKVHRCTARNFAKEKGDGYLDENGAIIWRDNLDVKRLEAKYNSRYCYDCKIFPICKGGCSQKALESNKKKYCVYNFDESRLDNIVMHLMDDSVTQLKNRI